MPPAAGRRGIVYKYTALVGRIDRRGDGSPCRSGPACPAGVPRRAPAAGSLCRRQHIVVRRRSIRAGRHRISRTAADNTEQGHVPAEEQGVGTADVLPPPSYLLLSGHVVCKRRARRTRGGGSVCGAAHSVWPASCARSGCLVHSPARQRARIIPSRRSRLGSDGSNGFLSSEHGFLAPFRMTGIVRAAGSRISRAVRAPGCRLSARSPEGAARAAGDTVAKRMSREESSCLPYCSCWPSFWVR
jgi:hypothetical protein